MKAIDRVLQQWRFLKVRPYLFKGVRVLDIGCGDGAFFNKFSDFIVDGVGLDAGLIKTVSLKNGALYPWTIANDRLDLGLFDVITLLAVFEHLPFDEQKKVAQLSIPLLKPQGFIVLTVPSPKVKYILKLLCGLRLIDGMCLSQHYDFNPLTVPSFFSLPGLRLVKHSCFQLGFNHLFVFQKEA